MLSGESSDATFPPFASADGYDPDGSPRESPLLQPKRLRLRLSPSPPPPQTDVSRSFPPSASKSDRRSSNRNKIKRSRGEAVLVQSMEGGRNPDIARFTAEQPPSDDECEDDDQENRLRKEDRGDETDTHHTTLGPYSIRESSPRPETVSAADGESRTYQSLPYTGQSREGYIFASPQRIYAVIPPDRRGGAMSLDDITPDPQPDGHRDAEDKQQRGQDHERQRQQEQQQPSPADKSAAYGGGLVALARAADAIAKPTPSTGQYAAESPAQPASSNRGMPSSTASGAPYHPGGDRQSPTREREPGRPSTDRGFARPADFLDNGGSGASGSSGYDFARRQQQQHPFFADSPSDGISHSTPETSQLLTPASAATPREYMSAPAALSSASVRDDRSVAGSSGATSLATPASSHHNDYASPYSPNGTTLALSPGHTQAYSPHNHADFHQFARRQRTDSLPPIQQYGTPRVDASSAGTPAASTNGIVSHASGGSAGGGQLQQRQLLPPIRQHLGEELESSPTNGEMRQPPYVQPSSSYRLPSLSHHSPPIGPDEVFRRPGDAASPGGSVNNAGGSHHSGSQYFFSPSAAASSYGGSRRGTVDFSADTPKPSEVGFAVAMAGAAGGGPSPSPGHLRHPMLGPTSPMVRVLPVGREAANGPDPIRVQLSITPVASHLSPLPRLQPAAPPPPPLQPVPQGPYVCQEPNCTALPFQTQYLLNSHANVHSSERPHYCPMPGCPRGVPGKGFKRKNEMIRHRLVHASPGYVCPFCSDREHKYPRPDNLQRHVRGHHKDINKDDPKLREVLAQRADGPSRGRRRRL